MLNDADMEVVLRVALFDGVGRDVVRTLIADSYVTTYEDRTLLFSRGDAADRFFVVVVGLVRLLVLTAEGRESVIEMIGPGQSFAEAAMFGSGRLPVDGEAEAGTRLVNIPARPILVGIDADPGADGGLARKMMASLARRQRLLVGRVTGFKVRSPGQRLAAALLVLTDAPSGAVTAAPSGAVTVALGVSKAGLASHIGISPESLSRALARLRAVGVSCRGSVVTINDVDVLRRYSDDSSFDA